MKKTILPYLIGALIATGGFFVISKVNGCGCFPKCLCSPCHCLQK